MEKSRRDEIRKIAKAQIDEIRKLRNWELAKAHNSGRILWLVWW